MKTKDDTWSSLSVYFHFENSNPETRFRVSFKAGHDAFKRNLKSNVVLKATKSILGVIGHWEFVYITLETVDLIVKVVRSIIAISLPVFIFFNSTNYMWISSQFKLWLWPTVSQGARSLFVYLPKLYNTKAFLNRWSLLKMKITGKQFKNWYTLPLTTYNWWDRIRRLEDSI